MTAAYLINRTPALLSRKTPYEMLFWQAPQYEKLRIFGSICYASWRPRVNFVGYPYGQKGWKLFDLDKEEIFVSRDVFCEGQFHNFSSLAHQTKPVVPWPTVEEVPWPNEDIHMERPTTSEEPHLFWKEMQLRIQTDWD